MLFRSVRRYNAGFVSINGDDDIFYKHALTLYKNADLRKEMGANAEAMLRDLFSVEVAAETIETKFKRI